MTTSAAVVRPALLASFLLSSASAACGGAQVQAAHKAEATTDDAVVATSQPFPSRDALDAILARPAPAFPPQLTTVSVKRWVMAGPTPRDPLGAETDSSPWTDVARSVAKSRDGELALSPALRCAASELSRFRAEHQGMPTEPLREYLAARCGFPFGLSAWGAIGFTVPKSMSDEKLVEQLRVKVEASLRDQIAKSKGLFGVGVSRRDDRFVVGWVFGAPRVDLDPDFARRDGAFVHLRGKFHAPVGRVIALANGDGFSVNACVPEPEVLPRFSLRCPLPSSKGPTFIDFAASQPGEMLGRSLASILVHDDDDASLTWDAPQGPVTAPLVSSEALGPGILAPLNKLRAALGARPLTLAPAQSALNQKLAPYMAAASLGGGKDGDEIARGVLAGWDVQGAMIRDASVDFHAEVGGSAGEWLASVLARPMSRLVLLDPQAEQVAIGGFLVPNTSITVALVSSYRVFHAGDHPDVADALALRLSAERTARGLAAPQRLVDLEGLAHATHAITEEGKDVQEALHDALQDASTRTGRSVRGLAVTTTDPTSAPLPPEMLATGWQPFAVAVGHRRPAGAAWGEYVVLWIWAA